MPTLASAAYLDSEFDVINHLPHAGSTLENPFVYDAVAKDLKKMADRGLLEIVVELLSPRTPEPLIEQISFRRLR